jgi:hypothetical protein
VSNLDRGEEADLLDELPRSANDVNTSLIYCLVRKKLRETKVVEAFETASRGLLDRILVALAKTLAIAGCTLATVVLIIWVFSSVVAATGNFVFAMLSIYLLGGAAAITITFIINIGHKVKPGGTDMPKTRTYLALVLAGSGTIILGTTFVILAYRIGSYSAQLSDSQTLIMYALVSGVSSLAVSLIVAGAYLFRSGPRAKAELARALH